MEMTSETKIQASIVLDPEPLLEGPLQLVERAVPRFIARHRLRRHLDLHLRLGFSLG